VSGGAGKDLDVALFLEKAQELNRQKSLVVNF
jgi:hypothetical protein